MGRVVLSRAWLFCILPGGGLFSCRRVMSWQRDGVTALGALGALDTEEGWPLWMCLVGLVSFGGWTLDGGS